MGETREFVVAQIKVFYWGTWWWSNLMNRSSCSNCSCEGNRTGEKVALIPARVVLSLSDRLLGSGFQAPASRTKGERLGMSAGLDLPGTCLYSTRACRSARRSPQSWCHATLHSGKKHQVSEGVCGAKPHDFFIFFIFFL